MAAILPAPLAFHRTFPVVDFDLAATLNSGQAFRWRRAGCEWEGVVANRWVGLTQDGAGIHARAAGPVDDWSWLAHYLQLDCRLAEVVATFPKDAPMQAALRTCRGLRLLRQDVWECLASFILSSTKQIVQIQQVVGRLCEGYGPELEVPEGATRAFGFPDARTVAAVSEAELRQLGMGFRAPYLAETARLVARGEVELAELRNLSLEAARAELTRLPGVGRKIADCVLVFGVGQVAAFPVDVWVLKTLRELYFGGRPVPLRRVVQFAESHFGPYAGYAQQYLFHAARARAGKLRG